MGVEEAEEAERKGERIGERFSFFARFRILR